MTALSRRASVALVCMLALGRLAAAHAAVALPESLVLQKPNEMIEAPDFTLKELSGKSIQLKSLRGKLVFLNFFATWCGPCREEMPGLDVLHRTYGSKGFVVLAVDMRESGKAVQAFVKELNVSFPTVLDADGAVNHDYGVRALPVSFLIGRDGKLLWRAIGARDWDSAQARRYFEQVVTAK